MILSHKHRFIFIHLGRTSGTSITDSLRPLLGPQDVVGKSAKRWWNRDQFHKHDTCQEVRSKVGEKCWNEYFKFTLERNPWEKILSKYWAYAGLTQTKFYKRIPQLVFGRPLSFAAWFRLQVWSGRLYRFGHTCFPRHFHYYVENNRVLVDFIGRFENRHEHLDLIGQRIGVTLESEHRRGNSHRAVRKPYTEYYDPWMRSIVERAFARDLEFLGYRFGQPEPTNAVWDSEALTASALPAAQLAIA